MIDKSNDAPKGKTQAEIEAFWESLGKKPPGKIVGVDSKRATQRHDRQVKVWEYLVDGFVGLCVMFVGVLLAVIVWQFFWALATPWRPESVLVVAAAVLLWNVGVLVGRS